MHPNQKKEKVVCSCRNWVCILVSLRSGLATIVVSRLLHCLRLSNMRYLRSDKKYLGLRFSSVPLQCDKGNCQRYCNSKRKSFLVRRIWKNSEDLHRNYENFGKK